MANKKITFEVGGDLAFWAAGGQCFVAGVHEIKRPSSELVEALVCADAADIGIHILGPGSKRAEIVESEQKSLRKNELAWKARHKVQLRQQAEIQHPDHPRSERDHDEEEAAAQAALEGAI